MTLTIDRLLVRGKIPRRSNVDRTLINRIAREEFANECGRQISRPWPVQARVARIRQLRIRVSIPAAQLQPDTLAKAWTEAFLRELFATLAHLNSVEILHFESRAEYVATAMKDLLIGVTSQRWAYEEFEHLLGIGRSEALLALFAKEHSEIIPILLILHDWGLLDRLLAVWDMAALERFLSALARETGAQNRGLSIEDLNIVAQLLFDHRFLLNEIDAAGAPGLPEGKIALKLFLGLSRKSGWRTAQNISVHTISQALHIICALLDLFKSTGSRWQSLTGGAEYPGDSIVAGSADDIHTLLVAAGSDNGTVFNELLNRLKIADSRIQENLLIQFKNIIAAGNLESRTAFAGLLEQLALVIGTGNGQDQKPKWISTDCAGLFLLIRVLDELGWEYCLTRSSFGANYGPRLLTYILAGVASAILGRFTEEPANLDSGMALFAGWIDQPNLDGFRDFLASGSVEKRRDLMRELLGEETIEECSINWWTCFDSLGNHLIREFTKHIRCFGKPSQSFVVKNFVALPGRIRIEEKRLVVIFDSSPLHIVLHLSGLDDPVEAASWLGGRRIEFQAEGFS